MTRVTNNGITIPRIRMPQKALSGGKNIFSINTSAFGRQTLSPLITNLFREQKIDLREIYVDNPAKVRLMAMNPTLKERVAAGERIDQILTGQPLELSLFITEDNRLYILGEKQNIQRMQGFDISKISQIKIPEMIDISEKLRIMKGELTVSQFRQFVEETGYKIEGYEAEELEALLESADAKDGNALTFLNLFDGRAYAKWLSERTGRKFRVQTEKEWLAAKDRLSGDNWTWTETKHSEATFVLRHLVDGVGRNSSKPEYRYRSGAVRLVEDLGERQNIQQVKMLAAGISQTKISEMVPIPAGKFKMGSTKYKNEGLEREVTISRAFAIGKYEVTNEEYKVYLEATEQEVPEKVADPAQARHPVANVSWNDAVAYCKWLSETTGKKSRLPTEAEREYVARGTDGRKYPWGNDWDASKATFNTGDGTSPVDAHPEGASLFGVMDLSGNVWEWTADWYAERYNPEDLKDPKGPKSGNTKVVRGGSWVDDSSDLLRSAYRYGTLPESRSYDIGFRVAEDLE